MSIETSTRCSCGTFVTLDKGHMWEALCPSCYGPVEDSGPREKVRGFGKTPLDALSDWQSQHDEAHEVEWRVTQPGAANDLSASVLTQMAEERIRQRAWEFDYAGQVYEAGTPLAVVQKEVREQMFAPDHRTNYITYGPEWP